jgi:hypothetical protein
MQVTAKYRENVSWLYCNWTISQLESCSWNYPAVIIIPKFNSRKDIIWCKRFLLEAIVEYSTTSSRLHKRQCHLFAIESVQNLYLFFSIYLVTLYLHIFYSWYNIVVVLKRSA